PPVGLGKAQGVFFTTIFRGSAEPKSPKGGTRFTIVKYSVLYFTWKSTEKQQRSIYTLQSGREQNKKKK
uniref:hypothetical protein n=1 Tax=Bacillus thuringiensis TaxID=1428 RepID=UPI001CA4C657